MRSWVARILLVFAFSVAFQLVLKPLRLIIVHDILIPSVLYLQSEPSDFKIQMTHSVAFHVIDQTRSSQNPSEWFAYTGFGNLYFLIGSVILILVGQDWTKIAWLFILHASLSSVAGVFLIIGMSMNTIYWIYAMDFTVSKAVPAATGMFVLMQKRKTHDA